MKVNTLAAALIALGISSSTLAAKQENLTLKVCLNNVKAVKIFTDEQCASQLQPCYTINTKDKSFKLNDTMNFVLKDFKFKKDKHGFMMIKGHGLWTGPKSAVDGKPFKDKTLFKGVGLAGSGIMKGVFLDSICKGEFEASIVK